MRLNLTSASQTFLANLLSTNQKTQISGFKIASASGYLPSANAVNPTGNLVYTGTPDQIHVVNVSDNEMSFIIVLDHTIGDFTNGNFIIYLKNKPESANPVPFIIGVVPVQAQKYNSDLPNHEVGNNIYIHATVWFPYLKSAIDITPHPLMYAQFKSYGNDETIPDPDVAEYEQYSLHNHTNINTAIFTIKENLHSRWWGFPLFQFVNESRLGHIDGGIVPYPHGSRADILYYDGINYRSNTGNFPLIDGGDAWAAANENPLDAGNY